MQYGVIILLFVSLLLVLAYMVVWGCGAQLKIIPVCASSLLGYRCLWSVQYLSPEKNTSCARVTDLNVCGVLTSLAVCFPTSRQEFGSF